MIVVFMGPPSSGKGTQTQILQDNLKIPKLSTGDMLRTLVKKGSEFGTEAKKLMKKGDLVPDDIVIDIIKKRILKEDCSNGFLLDGFPRTKNQAQALDKMLEDNNLRVDKVICLDVDTDIIVDRQAGRRVASQSGCVYHVEYNPPKVPGKCDVTGEDLIQREDDSEKVIRHRMKIYDEMIKPIIGHYKLQNKVSTVKADKPVQEVTEQVLSIIKK